MTPRLSRLLPMLLSVPLIALSVLPGLAQDAGIGDETRPTLESLTVSSSIWQIDGINTYDISLTASDAGSGIGDLRVLINHKGANKANRRGFFAWRETGYTWNGASSTDRVGCKGGGFAEKYDGTSGSPVGYGRHFTTLVSCSTELVGSQRTVTLTVRPHKDFGTFNNNDVAGWARDRALNKTGWVNFNLDFSSVSPCGANNAEGGCECLRFEAFRLEVDSEPVTHDLRVPYVSPVVVCTPSYEAGSDPHVVRIDGVTETSFDVWLQNPEGKPMPSESVACMVIEEGAWSCGGSKFEARRYQSTLTDSAQSWTGESQSYLQWYDEPVVVGQVMSANDPQWSVFWSRGPSVATSPDSMSLFTGKHVGEDATTERAPEEIGYFVFETGRSTLQGVEIDAVTTKGAHPYSQDFAASPLIEIASLSSMAGTDGGWAVVRDAQDASGSSALVVADEDTLRDAERVHVDESIARISLFGASSASPGEQRGSHTCERAYEHEIDSIPAPARQTLADHLLNCAILEGIDLGVCAFCRVPGPPQYTLACLAVCLASEVPDLQDCLFQDPPDFTSELYTAALRREDCYCQREGEMCSDYYDLIMASASGLQNSGPRQRVAVRGYCRADHYTLGPFEDEWSFADIFSGGVDLGDCPNGTFPADWEVAGGCVKHAQWDLRSCNDTDSGVAPLTEKRVYADLDCGTLNSCDTEPPCNSFHESGATHPNIQCGSDPGVDCRTDPNVECPTISVKFTGLAGGAVGVALDADLPDGTEAMEGIEVGVGESAPFSLQLPSGTEFSVRVTSQPPPPGELFDETECSLPSGTMTLGTADILIEGECENRMVSPPDICDLVPSLCIVFGTDPIPLTCLGGTLVFDYTITKFVCVPNPNDPENPICTLTEIQGAIKRDFLFCDFGGPFFTSPEVANKSEEPVELEGPYTSIGLPREGEVVSGHAYVFGYLMDQGTGIDTAYFTLDGQMIELEDYQTGQDNEGLCAQMPAEFGPCLPNSLYSGLLDTTNLSNGPHVLEVVGVNNDNPQGFTLETRQFIVDNDDPGGCTGDTTLPTVSLTAPLDGAELEPGTVSVTASAFDASGIEKVVFFVDGVKLGQADFSAPYGRDWNATAGQHTVRAKAKDNCGNVRWTPIHTVTVDGGGGCGSDVTGPQVSVTAPAAGSTHPAGNLAISASASDPNGVESVQFYVDGSVVAVDFAAPYSKTWNATEGSHTIQAGAIDHCGNESLSAEVPFTIEPVDPCDGDTSGPTVSVTSPAHGAELSTGFNLLTVNASDANGVQKVEFYVNGTRVATDTLAPYSYNWSATVGSHSLQARAYDQCGNSRWSSPVSVTVVPADPCDTDVTGPSISLTAPTHGSTHDAGLVNLTASASDPNGVESVQFYVDGSIEAVDFAAPYSKTWNATVGSHTLRAGGIDMCGNEAQSPPITVTIVEPDPCAGDTSGPTVSLTSPTHGAELPIGFNLLSASASDANGVQKVEFYVDGSRVATDTSSPFSHNWNAPLGSHALQARAYDQCGNDRWSSTASVTVVSTNPCDSDVSGPSISLTAPSHGSTHEAGLVNLTASASDPNGVESVQFYVDGSIEAVDFAAPYSKTWNATVGSHTLRAGGIDMCGNESQSSPITVTIVEPDPCAGDTSGPTVSITEPGHNSLHEPGTVTIRASASDPGGVQKVEFYVDDVLKATDTNAAYSWFWADGTMGWHTLKVRAFDNCGNSRWSAVIDVELGPTGPEDPPDL